MIHNQHILERLQQGNRDYLTARTASGDVSPDIRRETAVHGQRPFAVVVTCSDSRVIPEAIFSCGIGDLFVIRVAGNVVGPQQLGSIAYAAGHLGCKVVVVMGHTNCGAVEAAVAGLSEDFIRFLTDDIRAAIGDEKDDYRACCLNVGQGVERIQKELTAVLGPETDVLGAVYRIEDGQVDWL